MKEVYIDDDGVVQMYTSEQSVTPVTMAWSAVEKPTAIGRMSRRTLRLTMEELLKLGEYSMSLPTGTTLGKRWRRNVHDRRPDLPAHWIVGEYFELPPQERVDDRGTKYVGLRWYEVEIIPT